MSDQNLTMAEQNLLCSDELAEHILVTISRSVYACTTLYVRMYLCMHACMFECAITLCYIKKQCFHFIIIKHVEYVSKWFDNIGHNITYRCLSPAVCTNFLSPDFFHLPYNYLHLININLLVCSLVHYCICNEFYVCECT